MVNRQPDFALGIEHAAQVAPGHGKVGARFNGFQVARLHDVVVVIVVVVVVIVVVVVVVFTGMMGTRSQDCATIHPQSGVVRFKWIQVGFLNMCGWWWGE